MKATMELLSKYLDWQNLSDEAKAFGKSHLVVMSALYGVVEPTMGVRDYRLDMVDKVGINLYDIMAGNGGCILSQGRLDPKPSI